ncbi:hypothetical protein MRX96_024195 [Rhipicephalus microplus]
MNEKAEPTLSLAAHSAENLKRRQKDVAYHVQLLPHIFIVVLARGCPVTFSQATPSARDFSRLKAEQPNWDKEIYEECCRRIPECEGVEVRTAAVFCDSVNSVQHHVWLLYSGSSGLDIQQKHEQNVVSWSN